MLWNANNSAFMLIRTEAALRRFGLSLVVPDTILQELAHRNRKHSCHKQDHPESRGQKLQGSVSFWTLY